MEQSTAGIDLIQPRELARIIEKSDSLAIFLENWEAISRNLGLRDVQILEWKRKLNLETLKLQDLPNEILHNWKASKGSEVSLEDFCTALNDNGLHDITGFVQRTYYQNLGTSIIKNMKFISYQEEIFTLEDIVGQTYLNTICKILKRQFRKSFLPSEPIALFKKLVTPPEIPQYYVPRTLQHNDCRELRAEIFLSDFTHDNIFLFKGITKLDLAELTKYQAIEESGKQLDKVTVTFILLECDDDFDRICEIANKPVHLIERVKGRCLWVKSSGDLEIIRYFSIYCGKDISEDQMSWRILTLSGATSISIADPPGMGKTMLLASLARNIHVIDSEIVVLFMVLEQLMLSYVKMENVTSSVIETIASYAAGDGIAKVVLVEMMRGNLRQFYLFLDGYDEVAQDKLYLVDSFLTAAQDIASLKLIVTTRSHLQGRLENIFSQFSYELLPFGKLNQEMFLTKYWVDEYGAEDSQALNEFTKHCLESLAAQSTNLSFLEENITGIPLQCWALAEIYANYATRISKLEILPKNQIQSISFFEMYKRLIKLKFERVSKLTPCSSINSPSFPQSITNAHVYHSILLLFPQYADTLKSYLSGFNKINDNELLSIGIIVRSLSETNLNFMHHTMAEYFLADFIVQNLKKVEVVNLLFGEIMGRNGVTVEMSAYSDHHTIQSNYKSLAYYIENHLKDFMHSRPVKTLMCPKLRNIFSRKFKAEDVCSSIVLSCVHQFENVFDYTTKVLETFRINKKLKKKYFRNLPHVAVENLNDLTMLKKVLDFTKYELKLDLSFHECDFKRNLPGYLHINKYTPLHQAIRSGKYNFVTFLMKEYGIQIYSLNYLLHACVFDSAGDCDYIIEEKQLIIDMLVRNNRHLLDEKDQRSCSPLLQYNVHLILLKHLVKRGANINAHSPWEGTVIHLAINKYTYIDLLQWAFKNGFYLPRATNLLGETAREHICKMFGSEAAKDYDFYCYTRPGNMQLQGSRTQQMGNGNVQVQSGATKQMERDREGNEEWAIPNMSTPLSRTITVERVVEEIEKTATFHLLIENWRLFCEKLEIRDDIIAYFQRTLVTNTLSPTDLPRQILRAWHDEKGINATIDALCKVLDEASISDLAESLRTKFDGNTKLILLHQSWW